MVGFIIAIWLLAYLKAKEIVWVSFFSLLAVTAFFTDTAHPITIGLLYLLIVIPLFDRPVRQYLMSKPILKIYRKILPNMSQTEQEALEAGSVWWDGELFSGAPNWEKLLYTPMSKLTQEEQDFIDGPTETLCKMLDDWEITQIKKDLPPEVWQYIRSNGFMALIIPKQYGGMEFSAYAHSEIVIKIASKSITAAVTVMVPNSLGPGKLLLHYGTQSQKDYYLPRLAQGIELPCFALTGPDAGSDAGAMPDTGIVCYDQFDNKKTLGIKLNWEKRYITLGPVATLLGLAFKLYDPEHILGDQEELGITLALIKTDIPGIDIGQRHNPLNIPFQNGPNCGKDVFIPMDWVIGGPDKIGQGWRMLMECLADGRGISLPAISTSAGKVASRYTGAYAAIRTQFNMAIGKFEGIEEALARIAAYTYQINAARILTLSALDCGENPSVISAIIKYHLTESMRQVVNDAMDVQGGSGICLGPRNLIGRAYQAIPVSITVEGANILTRSMIIFGQGAIRCHPYVLDEIKATRETNPKKAIQQFDQALFGHIGFVISNAVRSFTLGITRGHIASAPVFGPAKRYYQHLTWMSAGFALTVDFCMATLGGSLKRREKLSARLGDIVSYLYLSSAVLKYFESEDRPEEDVALLRWCLDENLYHIQDSFDGVFRNLPFRPVAWLLRWVIFPTGKPFHKPSDKLGHQVASRLLTPSKARDRLTSGIYTSTDVKDRYGLLDIALEKALATDPIQKKIRQAQRNALINGKNPLELIADAKAKNIISETEEKAIVEFYHLKREVILVDAFEPDEL